MEKKKKLREHPIRHRILLGVGYSLIAVFILWLVFTPVIWALFNIISHPFGGRNEFDFIDVYFSFLSLFTAIATFIFIVFLNVKSGWWDNWEIDKLMKQHQADPKKGIRSQKAFDKLGHKFLLGEPNKTPGVVIATKQSEEDIKNEEMVIAVEPEYHTILFGPSGAGKTQIFNYPTIFHNLSVEDEYDEDGELTKRIAPFIIVVDVKGELHRETAGYAQGKGYNVHCLNTTKTGVSLSFNPLYEIHRHWRESKDTKRKVRDRKGSRKISETMLINTAYSVLEHVRDAKEPFWQNNEVKIFMGLTSLLFDLYDQEVITEEEVSLNTIFKLTTDIPKLIPLAKEYGVSEYCTLFLMPIINSLEADMSNRQDAGVIGGIQAKLMIFNVYKDITTRDELHLIDQKKKNILYLQVPDFEEGSYKIVSTFIEQLYVSISDAASMHKTGRAIRKIILVFDELANFPRINALPLMSRMSRSRGFQLFYSLQDPDALHEKYGKEGGSSIIAQCQTKIGMRLPTASAKFFSDEVGLRKKKSNKSLHTEREGVNVSVSEDMKEIIRADEIAHFKIISDGNSRGVSESIVITPRCKPAALVENRPSFHILDHLNGGYEELPYDIVETYYRRGTPIWDKVENRIRKEADARKSQWNSSEWKKKFIKDWHAKNKNMPMDESTNALMKEEMRKARKVFLEENKMIYFTNDVKNEVQKIVDELGKFDYNKVSTGAKVEKKVELKTNEIIGYATQLRDFLFYGESYLRKNFSEIWRTSGFEGRIKSAARDQWEKKKHTVTAVKDTFLIAEEIMDLLQDSMMEHKDKMKLKMEYTPLLKNIKKEFGFKSEQVSILEQITSYFRSNRIAFKKAKTHDASKITSVYATLGNSLKIRVSDHPSKTSGFDCHVEIIYDDKTDFSVFHETWNKISSESNKHLTNKKRIKFNIKGGQND